MTKFEAAVDLSQEPDVTHCNVKLPDELDFALQIYTTLGCISGSFGRYVYVYKSSSGNIVLIEVVVLIEARVTVSASEDSEYLYPVLK